MTIETTQQNGNETRRIRVSPRTDVFETEDALILVADVPGADQDSIELALVEDVLTLRARPRATAPEGWKAAGRELVLSDYERSFRLGVEIDRDAPSATLENGRLRVVLRKRQPRSNRIEVRAV
jgi:HSP20 family molecular chaperone IbpA